MKNREGKRCAICDEVLADARQKYCRKCVKKQYQKLKPKETPKKIKKTQPPKPDVSQCRTCLYRGDVNVLTCDYAYITGHMRGCDPSPNCTRYVKATPQSRKEIVTPNRQIIIKSETTSEYQLYFNGLIRRER